MYRLLGLLFLGSLFGGMAFSQSATEGDYFNDRIHFKLNDASNEVLMTWDARFPDPDWKGPQVIREVLDEYEVVRLFHPFKTRSHALDRTYELRINDPSQRDEIIARLSQSVWIDYAEKVPFYKRLYTPDDVSVLQWAIPKIDAELAWDQSKGSRGIVVAIVDDAVRITHEDIVPNLWVNTWEIPGNGIDDDGNGFIDDIHGYDVADNDNDPNPPGGAFSHGTHVAGISAAATDNSTGIASIGFNVRIMAVKTKLDASVNDPGLEATMSGVDYAISARADVVNMSFGGGGISLTYQALFNAGHAQGMVFVAAAGNDGSNIPHYPSSYDHVISVGSTAFSDSKSGFSNYHATVDVMAPGSSIYSLVASSDNSYSYMSGTSMASPMTAGLCALILSKNPGLDPDQVETCLESGCDNIDSQNSLYVGMIGAGRINANNSLTCVPAPAIPVANFNVLSDTVCGDVIFFEDSSITATDWVWDFGDGGSSTEKNPQHAYASSGSYTVTLIASNPTGVDTISQTYWFELLPAYSISAGPDTIGCKGDTISLWVTAGADDYIWSPISGLQYAASDTPKAKIFGDVTYIVTATDSNGCEAADSVTILAYPDPPISAGPDITIGPGDSTMLSASGGTGFTWSPADDLSCTSCSNPWASPDSTTFYTVEGTGANGCPGSDIVVIFVVYVGLDDDLQKVNVSVYPNPSSDRIHFEMKSELKRELEWQVIDLNGRIVREGTWQPNTLQSLEVTEWANGQYYLKLRDTNGQAIPFLVQH